MTSQIWLRLWNSNWNSVFCVKRSVLLHRKQYVSKSVREIRHGFDLVRRSRKRFYWSSCSLLQWDRGIGSTFPGDEFWRSEYIVWLGGKSSLVIAHRLVCTMYYNLSRSMASPSALRAHSCPPSVQHHLGWTTILALILILRSTSRHQWARHISRIGIYDHSSQQHAIVKISHENIRNSFRYEN